MAGGPIQFVEEAILLLRRQEPIAWLRYLVGAAPFLLALLTFVHDMSSGYFADRCAVESLVCAVTYFWSSAWKARFAGNLLATMNGETAARRAGFWHTLYLQSAVQALKLIAFPFAIVSILPAAWASNFFRNAAIEASAANATLRSVLQKSVKSAGFNARHHWFSVLILVVVYLLVFLNLYILLGTLPFLTRALSGVENSLTRNFGSFFTFNVFCIVLTLTWLLVDPLVQAYAVVRCFYTDARKDGRDLIAKLKAPISIAAMLLCLLAAPPFHASAKNRISDIEFSTAVDQAAKGDDYGWLRAQKQMRSENPLLKSLNHDIEKLQKAIQSAFKKAARWLRRLLSQGDGGNSDSRPSAASGRGNVVWLLYVLGALALIVAIVVLVRSLNRTPDTGITAGAEGRIHDLNQDSLLATDLPEEEWLRMARELLAKGEPRLAVRAMYLSNLSYLGSQHLIQIARAKSNSIYERELRLKPQGAVAYSPFAQSNRGFERAWYGFHEVTPEFVGEFQLQVEAIRQNVKA